MVKRFYSIMGNSQKLDGGAMFGNVPKALWQRWVDVDELNRIDLACRALLIVDKGKKILLETGIGAFFDPKMRERFGVQESRHCLLESLEFHGFDHQDIDIVILSHLHFDHAGGLLSAWQEGQEHRLLFPNAQFLVGKHAWQRAINPHPRDKASFIPGLTELLIDSGRLTLIEEAHHDALGDDYHFHISDGHTPGMLLTEVSTSNGPILFAADLIPAEPWVHLPITMGYDRFPEVLIDEKHRLLHSLLNKKGKVYFTHDSQNCLADIAKDDSGRFVVNNHVREMVNISM